MGTGQGKSDRLLEGYLIETRSTGGLSGSPVFVHKGTTRIFNKEGPLYLLGLIHGHWNWDYPNLGRIVVDAHYAEAINMGIGIVVPAQKILQVINQPGLEKMRKKTEAKWEKKTNATPDGFIDHKNKEKPFSKKDFEDALRKVSRLRSDEDNDLQ